MNRIAQSIARRILSWARHRPADFVIGGADNPYLHRHWLIPRNKFFNIYVHQFLRSDDDRALHDHPWLANLSWLIEGEYTEWTPAVEDWLMPDVRVRSQYPEARVYRAGQLRFRWGAAPHRVELHNGPCWTVFVTGPRVREWGFYCESGWIPWKRFTATNDPGAVGKGCDA